jgi:hypothetical protein
MSTDIRSNSNFYEILGIGVLGEWGCYLTQLSFTH